MATQPPSQVRPGIRATQRAPVDPGSVLVYLRAQHKRTVGAALLGLIAGCALLLFFGTVLVGLVMFLCHEFTGSTQYPYYVWYGAYLLILVPWMIAYVRRHGGSVYGDMVIGSGMFDGPPSSYGEYQMRSGTASLAMYAELLLWGPRTVAESSHVLFGADVSKGSSARMTRSAEALAQLLASGDGQPVDSLRKPDEGHEVLDRAIAWLVQNEHAGISADKQRVWASSEFRKRFAEAAKTRAE